MSNIINPVLEIYTVIASIAILSVGTGRLLNIMMDCKSRLVFVMCGTGLIFTFGLAFHAIMEWVCYNLGI